MNPPHPPDPASTDAQAAARQLGQVMKHLHRHISSRVMNGLQAELTDLDLSFSQVTALHHLRASGASTVTSLSERTRLSLPAASHLVERLVQRGLAQRVENPGNRREKLVSLTATGQGVLNQMDIGFVDAYEAAFSRLNSETLQTATTTLQALLDELDAAAPPPTCSPSSKENV